MAMMNVDPLREAMSLRDAMDRLFEESVVRRPSERPRTRVLRLPLDVYSTPEEIVITASLPGLTAEEVDITIEGDTLTIRGDLRPPLENVDYLMQERAHGSFARTLTLNVPINTNEAEATFENGVLTLTLPKAEETKPKSIKVKKK